MIHALTVVAGIVFLPLILTWGYARVLLKHTLRKQSPLSLDKRLWGYSLSEVRAYWEALGPAGRVAEERFLKWDLSYPFVYGGAIGAGTLIAGSRLVLPVPLVALLTPIAVASIADWVEDLTQLRQLRRYRSDRGAAVEAGPVRLASAATRLKLAFLILSILILLVLAGLLLRGALRTGG